jgi:hypothetical protein
MVRALRKERRELLSKALAKVQYPVLRSMPFDAKPAELIRNWA